MNKIIFVTSPDIIQGPTYALKNYNNDHIKQILSTCEQTTAFYLIDKDCQDEWLQKVNKQSKIIFDCSQSSIEYIVQNAK